MAVFVVLCVPVYLLLLYLTMTSTGRNKQPLTDEYIYLTRDFFLGNVAILILILGIVGCLGTAIGRRAERINTGLLCGITCLAAYALSLYWAGASRVEPFADQGYMCWYASDFNKGDFSMLERGGYVARYPQQLGVITVLRFLFLLFGDGNHRAFQYLNACFVPLLILSAHQVTRILSENDRRAECFCLFLFLFCFPMYGYVPFVYGEISSTACCMLAVWIFLRCMQRFSWKGTAAVGLLMGLAVLLRKNILIAVVALVIIGGVKLLQGCGWKPFAVSMGVVCGVILLQLALNGVYHKHLDPEAEAIPASLFVVMGLNDNRGHPGVYNGYSYEVFTECEDDRDAANSRAMADLKLYARMYRENPRYMADFFLRKINEQWNAPMYQFRMMTWLPDSVRGKIAESVYHETAGEIMEKIMEISQMAVYCGVLILLLSRRKSWLTIEKYVLMIIVFGGFLFSLIWEAKPRYVFPYYLLMLPCAAAGFGGMADILRSGRQRIKSYILELTK